MLTRSIESVSWTGRKGLAAAACSAVTTGDGTNLEVTSRLLAALDRGSVRLVVCRSAARRVECKEGGGHASEAYRGAHGPTASP
jgi:hypothetical protein